MGAHHSSHAVPRLTDRAARDARPGCALPLASAVPRSSIGPVKGLIAAGGSLVRIDLLALGAAVAVLSSTIPYALELLALRRLAASAFAILMSLAPATATLAGWLLLGQAMTWLEIVGIALVIAASIGAVRAASVRAATGTRGAEAPPAEPLP